MTSFKETDIALVTGVARVMVEALSDSVERGRRARPQAELWEGAGSGMGQETCRLLASQGATVVVSDIDEKAAQETLRSLKGKNHMSLKLNVTKKEEVEEVIGKVKAKYSSPPTITVNCAGLMLWEPLTKLTDDTFNRLFNVNVKGTVWVTQVVCKELVAAKKKGSIINIASIAKDGFTDFSIYAATKGAVESFSLSVAREFGPHGIRTNAISPGYVDTPMMTIFSEAAQNDYKRQNPMNRFAKPQAVCHVLPTVSLSNALSFWTDATMQIFMKEAAKEENPLTKIAEVIAFLASDKASYLNGASFKINGGMR